MSWLERQAKRVFLAAAAEIRCGSLELVCPRSTYTFTGREPGPAGLLLVHDERMFRRAIFGGDRGLGESFMDGDFSSPDLVSTIRLAVRNSHAFNRLNGAWSWLSRQRSLWAHRFRPNSPTGSRRNIAAHYDLGNEFFRQFLDPELAYSCAWFERDDDPLERAQLQKFERVCRKLQLGPRDHLLEIGTGWGGFAVYAATRYGCRVTTTTISREQHAYAEARFRELGEAGRRITLLAEDYRDLNGQFDRIASIEMFEAVGLKHYDTFFGACERLTAPGGAVLLQTITMNEQDFHATYMSLADWMQTFIFPGSELASLSEILRSLARVTAFRLFDLEDMGAHYARTVREWRRRFGERQAEIQRLGMDDRFVRMWDLYLAYSEAAFAERHISDVQVLLTRAYHDGGYFGEPWVAGQTPETALSAVPVRRD